MESDSQYQQSQPLVGGAQPPAATWGKKGVTAKQRQAAARAARLEPLSSQPSAALELNPTTNQLNYGDVQSEQQFVRQHLDSSSQLVEPASEADMAPNSPLIKRTRSVNSIWNSSQPNENDQSTKPVLLHISRPARSTKRLGEDGLLPPPTDQTQQVSAVLQSLKASNTAAEQPTVSSPSARSRPDEESTEVHDVIRPPLSVDVNAPADQGMDNSVAVGGIGADGTRSEVINSSLPPPPAEPSLCSCCPCLDSFTSQSCFASLTHAFNSWIGHAGKDAALAEMRTGVILSQDAQRANVEAIEAHLNRQPEACVLNIRVRRTDELLADSAISHPMVKLHILDLRTGAYWRKKDKSRHAVAPYENLRHTGGGKGDKDEGNDSAIESILPILSHPYKLKSHGSFIPLWDENLLINEPLRNLLDVHTMFFFEILDFGPAVDLREHPSGYFPIAWAFLKPLSSHGEPNLGVNQQLQLYKYTNLGAARETFIPFLSTQSHAQFQKSGVPQVYYEWIWQKHTGRIRYPATFFMDFTGVAPPQREKVKGARPLLPTQIEEGRLDLPELMATITPADADLVGLDATTAAGRRARKVAVEQMSAVQRAAVVRHRRVGDPCLIPNNLVHEISAGLNGCFVLRYSPDGRTLAAACGDGLMFTIKLYDSDSGTQLYTYVGHHDLIYDLGWNCLGTEIVSASSDGTAKVWAVDATRTLPLHQLRPQAVATLQHTGYVYTCAYHPKLSDKTVILTGSFDGALRFWNNRGELLHILQDHTSYINSVVFAPNGTRIFTGDADGIVKVWEDTNYTRATTDRPPIAAASSSMTTEDEATARPRISDNVIPSTWANRIRCLHTIAHEDLKGNIITCIRYHPRPERLVVYCRDNCLYVFSLLRYDIRKVLSGIPCQHHSLHCAISPDGDKLVAGGEDGHAYFWDLNEGELLKVMDVGYHSPMYDVSWHPNQQAIAVSSFGGDYPIRVFEYNSAKDVRPPEEVALAQTQRETTARFATREPLPPLHGLPISAALSNSQRGGPQLQPLSAATIQKRAALTAGTGNTSLLASPLPPPKIRGETLNAPISPDTPTRPDDAISNRSENTDTMNNTLSGTTSKRVHFTQEDED